MRIDVFEEAEGKERHEAQMSLNHKIAIHPPGKSSGNDTLDKPALGGC